MTVRANAARGVASAGLRLATVVVLSVLGAIGAASAEKASDIERLDLLIRGQALAAERCGRCHATGNADTSPHEKAPPFRLVADTYPPEHLAEALAEGIVSGHPDMPVFVLAPAEIEAFLVYLDSLGGASEGPAAAPAEVKPEARPGGALK